MSWLNAISSVSSLVFFSFYAFSESTWSYIDKDERVFANQCLYCIMSTIVSACRRFRCNVMMFPRDTKLLFNATASCWHRVYITSHTSELEEYRTRVRPAGNRMYDIIDSFAANKIVEFIKSSPSESEREDAVPASIDIYRRAQSDSASLDL